jgi:hypothetical protein
VPLQGLWYALIICLPLVQQQRRANAAKGKRAAASAASAGGRGGGCGASYGCGGGGCGSGSGGKGQVGAFQSVSFFGNNKRGGGKEDTEAEVQMGGIYKTDATSV